MYLSARRVLALFVCALFCLASATICAADPTMAELLNAAKAGAEAARVKAIDEIGARGEKAAEAVPALAAMTTDTSAAVRAHAAHALGAIGLPAKSAATALSGLLKDKDDLVRRQAVKALAAIRPGPQVMVPLFIQLMDDPDEGVRQRILQAASEAGPVVVPSLIEGLKNEKAAYWACLLLRDMGPAAKSAVPELTKLLADPRVEIRREATLALGAMLADGKPAAGEIAKLLADEQLAVAATFALGEIGEIPQAAEAPVRANAQGGHKLLSTVSLWALARVHPSDAALTKEAAEKLIGRLTDTDPFVRAAAAKALAALKVNPEVAFPIYEKALATADEATTRHALDALVGLGAQAVPRLIAALQHKGLRSHAAYVLGQIGQPAAAAVEPLTALVGDADPRVANEAAMALARLAPASKTSVPALVKALDTPDSPSSHAIVYALGKIGPAAASAKPVLVKLIKEDPSLAVLCAASLTQIDPASPEVMSAAVPALVAGLGDHSTESRQLAAAALANVKALPPAAVAALEKAAQDTDQAVSAAANEALQAVRGRAAK